MPASISRNFDKAKNKETVWLQDNNVFDLKVDHRVLDKSSTEIVET